MPERLPRGFSQDGIMQIERSRSVSFSHTANPARSHSLHAGWALARLDLQHWVTQPPAPLRPTPGAEPSPQERRNRLVSNALLAGTLTLGTLSLAFPMLPWWALAGAAGGSAGVAAAVHNGLAPRAHSFPGRDLAMWPLNIQRKSMLEAVHALHGRRPQNAARNALYDSLQRSRNPGEDYASLLRALGPLGEDVADTHAVLKYMRWHMLLDKRNLKAPSATAAALWGELERLACMGEPHLLYDDAGQQAWAEARLAFVLHRGLLPQLLQACPVLQDRPEWFCHTPHLSLKKLHVAQFVDYWQSTPAMDTRFVQAVLNPAWL